ncbi:MAG: trigger factor family protein [Cytophagales bacterium]|nr:trigger factor family protein [Cytophagales bacterium]
MNIELVKSSEVEGLLKVKLNSGDYQSQVEDVLSRYRKKVHLKGFRKGKTPMGYVRKIHGRHVLVDVLQEILSDQLQKYIQNQKLDLIGTPILQTEKLPDVENLLPQEIVLEYLVGWTNSFALERLSSLRPTQYIIRVQDEVVEEAVENIRVRYGKTTESEFVEDGDLLWGDLKDPSDENTAKDVFLPTEKMQEDKHKEDFMGRKKEETISFSPRKLFGKNLPHSLIRVLKKKVWKEKGVYHFTIRRIDRVEKMSLSPILFEKVFGKDVVKDKEDFYRKVREQVEENYQRETENFFLESLKLSLLNSLSFPLPEVYIKSKWEKEIRKEEEEDSEKSYQNYLRSFRWSLVVGKIVRSQRIEVGDEDIIHEARAMIHQRFQLGEIPQDLENKMEEIVRNFLSVREGENTFRLRQRLQERNALSWLRTQVNPKTEKLSREEFNEKVQEYENALWKS